MLTALLAWFDEDPRQLAACILSLTRADVGHVVAVDGAYALYPGGTRHSPAEQHLAIQYACGEAGIGLTLHAPPDVWHGNECEKRTALFALGEAVAGDGDWLLIIDADEIVHSAPEGLHGWLEQSEHDVAEVTMHDPLLAPADETTLRRLYRAQPITVEGNHWTHKRADGSVIAGHPGEQDPDCLDLRAFRMEHRRHARAGARVETQGTFYDARNATGEERGPCKCGAPGTRQVATGWRMSDIGPVGDLIDACDRCAKRLERREARRLADLGIQIDHVSHRYGKAPA